MLRNLNNRRAQASFGEYALVIFVVLTVLTGMTVYFKRAVQARIRDSLHYAVNDVQTRTGASFNGDMYLHYEPYYTNTRATIASGGTTTKTLRQGWTSGIFQKNTNKTTDVSINSETAPPMLHNLTTPTMN